MYNGKHISLKSLLWEVMDNPHVESLNYDDAASYVLKGLRLIGAPLIFIDATYQTELSDYKAALPSNLIHIRGVKLMNGNYSIPLRRATDLYHTSIKRDDTGPSFISDDLSGLPTSPYDDSNQGVNTDITATTDSEGIATEYTYIAQNGVIQASVKDGPIDISYRGIACDDDGYPLIPDNEKVTEALRYYIIYRYMENIWSMGKITDKVFQHFDQQKAFYMGAADTSMRLQGIDHLDSTMNAINRLIVNTNAYNNFYKGSGIKERIKKY